jgi:hypothetical protein
MDPGLANQDFDPPPSPGWGRWVLPAIAVHVPLALALALGVDWKQQPKEPQQGRQAQPPQQAKAPPEAKPAAATAAARPAAAQPAVAAGPLPRTTCPLRPVLGSAGGKDGQLLPPAELTGKNASDITALVQTGKEAAASGQRRDAEVAFLTACRIADAVNGPASVESADARYQLGRHYAAVVEASAGAAPEPERQQLRQLAQAFYADSLQGYQAKLGEKHEKSVFAAEGLAALQQGATQVSGAAAAPMPPAAAPAPAPTRAPVQAAAPAAPAPAPARPVPQAQRQPAPAPERAAAAPAAPAAAPAAARPSFDCGKARSVPERLICADPELAQFDRDLGRLHARARNAASDAAAFRRQNEAEWRRREANCRDRECLLQWYTHRRQQLLVTLEEAGQDPQAAAGR